MATPEAIYCIGCANDISKSSRDRRKLVPDSTGNSCKIASSVWMEVSLQEATAAISSGDKKGAGEEHSKGSFHTPLEGWKKNIPPSKERHDYFQVHAFQCVIL